MWVEAGKQRSFTLERGGESLRRSGSNWQTDVAEREGDDVNETDCHAQAQAQRHAPPPGRPRPNSKASWHEGTPCACPFAKASSDARAWARSAGLTRCEARPTCSPLPPRAYRWDLALGYFQKNSAPLCLAARPRLFQWNCGPFIRKNFPPAFHPLFCLAARQRGWDRFFEKFAGLHLRGLSWERLGVISGEAVFLLKADPAAGSAFCFFCSRKDVNVGDVIGDEGAMPDEATKQKFMRKVHALLQVIDPYYFALPGELSYEELKKRYIEVTAAAIRRAGGLQAFMDGMSRVTSGAEKPS